MASSRAHRIFVRRGHDPNEGPTTFQGPLYTAKMAFRAMKGLYYTAKGPYYPGKGPFPRPKEPN